MNDPDPDLILILILIILRIDKWLKVQNDACLATWETVFSLGTSPVWFRFQNQFYDFAKYIYIYDNCTQMDSFMGSTEMNNPDPAFASDVSTINKYSLFFFYFHF